MQPAAKAGATLQAIWFIGQFHGVIIPTTPTGSFTIKLVPNSSSKLKFAKIPAVVAKWNRPVPACAALARPFGAPISEVIAVAKSSDLDPIISVILFNSSSRS